ncbi:hypothetical protein DQ04_04901010 [Trypanosoma grayi]|uniref:hypothetical protein n=1 Tax=Trypanosoma grayi TaxID=71804 RepID=UPI0004F43D59|nr:hypothetical protein DQ04_04901010 [Trypanosoma grayi]KEG09637.1 hypothetical protein DQ04_04901010 [Trypanosoma grayi]
MSVSEVFLRDGVACTKVDALGTSMKDRYPRWTLLVVLQRQWSRDRRANRLYAPAFQLLFASSAESEDEITTAADDAPWHLLFYDTKLSCREALWEEKVAELITQIWKGVPSGLHPSCFSVICVTVGTTHERLGLFSERAFSLFKERVERVLFELGLQRASVQRHNVLGSRADEQKGSDACTRLPAFVEQAIQWVCHRTPEAADVSAPSQKGNDAILQEFLRLHKLLYTASFQESVDAIGDDAAPAARVGECPNPKLMEERRVAVNNLKKRVGHVVSFALTSPTSSEHVGSPWYVLLLQKPLVEKQEVSIDNLDPGPLEPQPIGAELHMMHDCGEVLYLQSELCDERNLDTVYEDIMHEDGELFAQLTPVEGIAFDDIDHYLEFLSAQQHQQQEMTAEKVAPMEPLCKGSCCNYTFPKVVVRRPTGSVVKSTAISSPHAEILEESPHTPEQWEAARLAFAFLSQHITPVSGGGYTLARDVAPVPPPPHGDACSWCGRRRNKLLRCGGCRVEMYCCKKHQMMDWKGGHKGKCGLWRKAREDYEQRVVPLLQTREVDLPTTPSASAVVTLLQFLTASQHELQELAFPVVHIIGIDTDVSGFLAELAHRVKQIVGKWKQLRLLLCSDAFSDEEQNAVYAVDKDGDVTRTKPTSVLGDAWHTQSDRNAVDAVALVRLYSTKYHIFITDALAGSITPAPGTTNSCGGGGGGGGFTPSAVVSFSSPSGAGMTYFSAAAEVFAKHFVGVIPVMCTEATLVGAHNTLDAIFSRVKNNAGVSADHNKKLLSLHTNPDDLIQLNASGMCSKVVEMPTTAAADTLPTTKQTALVPHLNLYCFTVPVLR